MQCIYVGTGLRQKFSDVGNLSKRDADLFIKVCSHSFMSSVTGCFLPNNKEYVETVGIQYADIMKLSEFGLRFNDGAISLKVSISDEPRILISNHSLIMC